MNAIPATRWLAIVALAFVIIGNAVASVLLKMSATAAQQRPPFLGFINLQFIAGVGCFGVCVIAYAWALRYFPLHIAQIALSLQYVLAIFLAGTLLREQIGVMQWAGILCITIGLYLCTR